MSRDTDRGANERRDEQTLAELFDDEDMVEAMANSFERTGGYSREPRKLMADVIAKTARRLDKE